MAETAGQRMSVAVIAKSSKKIGRGSKPGERRGGRKRGTPNKVTKSVKEAILAAFDQLGGSQYLFEQGKSNPNAFIALLGKVLPTQINADVTTRELPASVDEFV